MAARDGRLSPSSYLDVRSPSSSSASGGADWPLLGVDRQEDGDEVTDYDYRHRCLLLETSLIKFKEKATRVRQLFTVKVCVACFIGLRRSVKMKYFDTPCVCVCTLRRRRANDVTLVLCEQRVTAWRAATSRLLSCSWRVCLNAYGVNVSTAYIIHIYMYSALFMIQPVNLYEIWSSLQLTKNTVT